MKSDREKIQRVTGAPFCRCLLIFLVSVLLTLPAQAGRPLILTTIHPLTLIAHELAGDWVEIRQLLPEGELPHQFSLNLTQRQLLEDADLLVWVGPALEGFLEKALETRPPPTLIRVLALRPVRPLGSATGTQGAFTEPVDPHVWLDPEWGIAIGVAMADWLVTRFPRHQREILDSLTEFTEQVRQLSGELSREFSAYAGGRYISDHQAFSHFTRRYAIEYAGSLHDDSGMPLGVRAMDQLLKLQHVSCLVEEPRYDRRRMESTAATMGIRALSIDPLGSAIAPVAGSYLELIRAVAAGFRACFASPVAGPEPDPGAEVQVEQGR